jgi:hypothetical protein
MDELTLLRLSVQRALLGEITSNMVAVTCGIKGFRILVRAYYDELPTDSDVDRLSSIASQIIGDFSEAYEIDEKAMAATTHQPIRMLDFWAFIREGAENLTEH